MTRCPSARRPSSLKFGRASSLVTATAGALGSGVIDALCYTNGAVKVTELGHVSLFVRDLERSARFYRDLLGLHEAGRGKGGRIVFLSAGAHHHDVSLELARAQVPPAP